MRLVTFIGSGTEQRLGSLVERDSMVVDLQQAHVAEYGGAQIH